MPQKKLLGTQKLDWQKLDAIAKHTTRLKAIDSMPLTQQEKSYVHSAVKGNAAKTIKTRNKTKLKALQKK